MNTNGGQRLYLVVLIMVVVGMGIFFVSDPMQQKTLDTLDLLKSDVRALRTVLESRNGDAKLDAIEKNTGETLEMTEFMAKQEVSELKQRIADLQTEMEALKGSIASQPANPTNPTNPSNPTGRPRNIFIDAGANKANSMNHFVGVEKDPEFEALETAGQHNKMGGWELYIFEGNPKFDQILDEAKAKIEALPETFPGAPFKVNLYKQTLVGDRATTIDFFIDLEQQGYSSSIKASGPSASDGTKFTLPMVDISHFILTKFSVNDFIVFKMDVEGAETEILQQMFAQGVVPYIDEIYIEYHGDRAANYPEYHQAFQWVLNHTRTLKVGDWS